MDNIKEDFTILLNNAVKLYVDGILVQYGINEEQALEIVTNLTKIPREKLIELKQSRDNELLQNMNKYPDEVNGVLGINNNFKL